jgi:hypothetical protein
MVYGSSVPGLTKGVIPTPAMMTEVFMMLYSGMV